MHIVAVIAGFAFIGIILVDAFETIILPRRVTRRLRLTRYFILSAWRMWLGVAKFIRRDDPLEGADRRDRFFAVFGPLALLLLLAVWAIGLVLGYTLLHWGFGDQLQIAAGKASFGEILYMSGTTFFTLGLGDVTPVTTTARFLTVAETATGFSFLALTIGYLPVIYNGFATREVNVTLLDARAGSPPSAAELLRRFGPDEPEACENFLREWERWAADVLESHLSYPVLAFFRSQHENQSWLSALTVVLDACALIIVGIVDQEQYLISVRQARITFAMARHAVGDMSQVLSVPPVYDGTDRLPPDRLVELRQFLAKSHMPLREGDLVDEQLVKIRRLYEPYVAAIGQSLMFPLPPWMPLKGAVDDWQTTAWQQEPQDAIDALGPYPLKPRVRG
ncbi:MAG: potassium channel family protein [Thermomicrobiales bacterium]